MMVNAEVKDIRGEVHRKRPADKGEARMCEGQ